MHDCKRKFIALLPKAIVDISKYDTFGFIEIDFEEIT